MEPLQFEVIVQYTDSEQKVWINLPNTYWTRFFLYPGSERIERLEELFAKFNYDSEALEAYVKGKLYETSISDLPNGSFKCENPDLQEILRDDPKYFQEILQNLVNRLIQDFNKDMVSVVEKGNSKLN